jgi:2-dehydro-3-deoxyphosphogluconate aldolase / (4S)-4-hydroxy-2-oxoglutarate aldolase
MTAPVTAHGTADGRDGALDAILAKNPIIPVITIDRLADAVPLARALVAGGITALEITLRTPVALDAATAIIKAVPDAIVGLGTVTRQADLDAAERIGARFIISPGTTPALLVSAAKRALPYLPGVATASDVMAAVEAGYRTVKFFPAVPAGGIPAIRALAGPFPDVRFCPTGGISEANAADWLAVPGIVAVGGSWLAPQNLIRAGDFGGITDIAARSIGRVSAAKHAAAQTVFHT